MPSDNQRQGPVHLDNCAFCGSANIVRGVKIDQTADAGGIGLSYKTRFLIVGTESIFADLCDDCGSVLRTVEKAPGRKWVTK